MAAAPVLGDVDPATPVSLVLGLAVDHVAMKAAVRSVSDPKSPSFRHYLKGNELADRFGASERDYEAVAAWAESHHFKVGRRHTRLTMDIDGAVSDVGEAFHVKLQRRARTDGTEFYSPDVEPSVDLAVPLEHVSNLDNFARPVPKCVSYNNNGGSGCEATALGPNDLYEAYAASSGLAGSGQTVAIFDNGPYSCILPSDINSWKAKITRYTGTILPLYEWGMTGEVPLPGETSYGTPQASCAAPSDETTLDVDMVMATAPAAQIVVFGRTTQSSDWIFENIVANGPNDTFGSEAGIRPWPGPVTVVTDSWGPTITATAITMMDAMALSGQSFFQASGDTGAYTSTNLSNSLGSIGEQSNTQVGGTDLVMTDAGNYNSEVSWCQSGGGILSATQNGGSGEPIPWYQLNLATSSNGGSTNWRMVPDVSAAASGIGLWVGGTCGKHTGTSMAAPLWAGVVALANEAAASASLPNVGYANPVLYQLAEVTYSGGGSYFHDVTSGQANPTYGCDFADGSPSCVRNDAGYTPTTGYDLVTGLGSPTPNLIAGLAGTYWTWLSVPLTSGQSGKTLSSLASIAATPPGNTALRQIRGQWIMQRDGGGAVA